MFSRSEQNIQSTSPSLSPENFTDLFKQYSNGNAAIGAHFQTSEDVFACLRHPIPATAQKIWIFDADDTLWEDNLHYEELIKDLHDYLLTGGVIEFADWRQHVNDAEHEIIPQMGMGPVGFQVSLRRAFETAKSSNNIDLPVVESFFDSIIPTLSAVPKFILPGVPEVLAEIQGRSDTISILMTQGTLAIQQGKIANSDLGHLFDGIFVVKDKKTETYQIVMERLNVQAAEIVVVGNSVNSEIKPALELGWSAVFFDNPNTWKAVNSELVEISRYHSVKHFQELLKL